MDYGLCTMNFSSCFIIRYFDKIEKLWTMDYEL
jgi:hypothetical protein